MFVACARAALIAIVLLNLYYAFGAAGFSYGGNSFSFGRQHDRQLYAIDDRRAFLVTGRDHPTISVVKYEEGPLPLILCGRCTTAGGVFPFPRYRKGDWLYTDIRVPSLPAAYNLKTGELRKDHDFPIDSELLFDVDAIIAEYKPIRTISEMCVILEAAGFIVVVILALIALILLPFGLRRRRAAQNLASR